MARKHILAEHDPPTLAPAPHVVSPTAVYGVEEARALLKLKASTIRREVREGRLRISKRAGRYFLLGEWILEWIRAGEITSRNSQVAKVAPSNGTTERN